MPVSDDDLMPREVSRALRGVESNLSDFRHEMRGQLQQLVRTDVYRAEQAATQARIAALEKDVERLETERSREREQERESASANRRQTNYAITGAVLSFIGSLLLVLFTR